MAWISRTSSTSWNSGSLSELLQGLVADRGHPPSRPPDPLLVVARLRGLKRADEQSAVPDRHLKLGIPRNAQQVQDRAIDDHSEAVPHRLERFDHGDHSLSWFR